MTRTARSPVRKSAKRPAKRAAAKRVGGRSGAAGSADGDAAVRAYIASLVPWQRTLAQLFDDIAAREVPALRRVIKWGMPFYGVPDRGWVVSCGALADCVKVTFFHGASLKPLPPVGTGKQLRAIDLRPGGAWRYVWRKDDGAEMPMGGTYREVVPPERLVSTERWGPEWPETVNTVVLTESGGRTTISLTVLYPSKEARDAALQTGMKEGMDQGFARLDEVLRALAGKGGGR